MNNEETTKPDVGPNGEIIVTDPAAAMWYKEGFRFAFNYLHSIIPETNEHQLNRQNFKDFVNSNFLDVQIVDDFFELHPIIPADAAGIYPHGLCPGPDGTCVSCPSRGILPN